MLQGKHETNLWTPSVKNTRVIAFLFGGGILRHRKKSKCQKLCCGALISVSPDGRWNLRRLPCLSLLGIFVLEMWNDLIPLEIASSSFSSNSSMFLLNFSLQTDVGFLVFELPWNFLICRKSLMMHKPPCSLNSKLNQNFKDLLENFKDVITPAFL